MDKKKIRKLLLKKRNTLSKMEVNRWSNEIFHRFITTEEYKNAKTIMFYVSKDNEVETKPIIEYAIKHKKNVCVPKTDRIKHKLYPIKIKSLNKDLQLGIFGLQEPILNRKKIVPVNKIDLIITPGIAFDINGYRLGWGKGYYDRFLEKTGVIPKIGLAFTLQIVPKLPVDKHDMPMDMVITEKRIINKLLNSNNQDTKNNQ